MSRLEKFKKKAESILEKLENHIQKMPQKGNKR